GSIDTHSSVCLLRICQTERAHEGTNKHDEREYKRPMRMRFSFLSLVCCAALLPGGFTTAQTTAPILIEGPEQQMVDVNKVNGGLKTTAGVLSFEVFHADKEHPEKSDGLGWTYHHHVDLAVWKGQLYVGWNSCEKDEDTWPSHELYST